MRRQSYKEIWLRKPTGLPRARAYRPGKKKQVIVRSSALANALIEELSSQDNAGDIFKIDLSQIVSRYIGETEKNLNALFNDAESKGAILFFDEADALFGKRTGVRDAHDRYAREWAPIFIRLIKTYKGIVIIGLKD